MRSVDLNLAETTQSARVEAAAEADAGGGEGGDGAVSSCAACGPLGLFAFTVRGVFASEKGALPCCFGDNIGSLPLLALVAEVVPYCFAAEERV